MLLVSFELVAAELLFFFVVDEFDDDFDEVFLLSKKPPLIEDASEGGCGTSEVGVCAGVVAEEDDAGHNDLIRSNHDGAGDEGACVDEPVKNDGNKDDIFFFRKKRSKN